MTNTQTAEILDVLKTLPSDKIDEVKDFAVFLRERYGRDANIDESDEWSDEDLRDFTQSTLQRFERSEDSK